MSANPQDFATKVLAAFKDAMLFTVEEVERAGGPSSTTITKLRKAAKGAPLARPRGDTMRRIDTAAKWPDGSAAVLWELGELPDRELSRVVGTGGVPAPEVEIYASSSRVERGDPVVFRVTTNAVDRTGNESRLELRYWPGEGREVTVGDLAPVASMAHREAVRTSYMSGTRPSLRDVSDPGESLDAAAKGGETEPEGVEFNG